MKYEQKSRPGKPKILLLFGGESPEHEVSIRSAKNVYAAIDRGQYNVILVYVDKSGCWWRVDEMAETAPNRGEQVVPVMGQRAFMVIPGGERIIPNVILPILHGRNGEDGSIQGLGQLLGVPVVGCDMTASVLCMDKVAAKQIVNANGVSIVPYMTHRIGEPGLEYDEVVERLGESVFIKPAGAGSSVGVSLVAARDQWAEALQAAHRHDSVVLIEQAIQGRELEVAVLGNPPYHEVSGVGEIIPGDTFYSYDAKYSSDSDSKVIVSADLGAGVEDRIRTTAQRAYSVLGCRGMARIDFFLSDTGELYLNEINSIPGFTSISMYPKLWEEKGMSQTELISRLISAALDGTM